MPTSEHARQRRWDGIINAWQARAAAVKAEAEVAAGAVNDALDAEDAAPALATAAAPAPEELTLREAVAGLTKLARFLDDHSENLTKSGVHVSAHQAGLNAAACRDLVHQLNQIAEADATRALAAAHRFRAFAPQEKTNG
jgi:hypothetical protein